ncbi:MAG: FAD-binding oxidoreductase [Nanoarchaeota archaeon]
MEQDLYKVKIFEVEETAKNVHRFRVERPEGYNFIPGQSTFIYLEGCDKREFSFSNSEKDFLEFNIKSYLGGVTEKIGKLKPGDFFEIGKPFGIKAYHGNGVFIAGGTGITPYLGMIHSISPEEAKKNILIYSVHREEDIISKNELEKLFGKIVFVLTKENKKGYEHGRINKELLQKFINKKQEFYICGPSEFVKAMRAILFELGVEKAYVW